MTALLNNLTDLAVESNLNEAWAELRRCSSDADFAAWARTFAEPCLITIEDGGLSSTRGD